MNSKQRRKLRRVMKQTQKKLTELTASIPNISDKWDQILAGMGPTGKTNKWEISNVNTK